MASLSRGEKMVHRVSASVRHQTETLTLTSEPATLLSESMAARRSKINPELYQGIKVIKFNSKGRAKQRILTISRSNFMIFITPSRVRRTDATIPSMSGGHETSTVVQKVPKRGIIARTRAKMSGESNNKTNARFIDICDVMYLQKGYVGNQHLEKCIRQTSFRTVGEESFLTIVHRNRATLDLRVHNPKHRDNVYNAIMDLIHTYASSKTQVGRDELLIRYIWHDIDQNCNGTVDEKEMKKVMDKVNIDTSRIQEFRDYMKEVGESNNNVTFEQCMAFLKRLKVPKGTTKSIENQIWDTVFGEETMVVSDEDFLTRFFHDTQKELDLDTDYVKSIFDYLHGLEISAAATTESASSLCQQGINRMQFEAFLHSHFNDVYDNCAQQHVDESKLSSPLTHYWINTSHNTYLTGDQLRSTSDAQMYTRALQRGCKCLELDCWDGKLQGTTPIPVVYHGYTMTSKIKFEDIICCVKRYMDANPHTYPIILSLENHCSHSYQKVMANILETMLGDVLYIPDPDGCLTRNAMSPLELKGKVVIKGKRPPEPDDDPVDTEVGRDDESHSIGSGDSKVGKDQKKLKIKTVPELAKLTFFHGVKFKAFERSIEMAPSHMHSINEAKMIKILENNTAALNNNCPPLLLLWRKYNINHMTRTYPKGSRVDSSNYNPLLSWSMGCQMVALNIQTPDAPLMINDGAFRANGGCGYVRKPDWMLREEGNVSNKTPVKLRIRVLSGHCLPKPEGKKDGECIDPYVRVTLHDVDISADNPHHTTAKKNRARYLEKTYETSTVDGNGFSPIWNEPNFEEFLVRSPDIAVLRFTVMEADVTTSDDEIAHAAVPVALLRFGFRSVQLYDEHNTRRGPFDFCTLLIEVGCTNEHDVNDLAPSSSS